MLTKVFILVIIVIFEGVLGVCPPAHVLSQCTCRDDHILCGGSGPLDVSALFDSIRNEKNHTQRHYNSLEINNTRVTQIGENAFKDLTFDVIYVHNCDKLTKIDQTAFTQTNMVTKHLEIYENYDLDIDSYSLFDIISKFRNLEYLYLKVEGLTIIPRRAFKPVNGYQDRLTKVYIRGIGFDALGEFDFDVI